MSQAQACCRACSRARRRAQAMLRREAGGRRRRRDTLGIVLRAVVCGLSGYGSMFLPVPFPRHLDSGGGRREAAPAETQEGRRLSGPSPGHPERLAPELPPSRLERRIWAGLSSPDEPPDLR